jgi:hypothetical protein
MYGCHQAKNPENCRILPYILSKLSDLFHYPSSRFGIQKEKEATARVAIFKELKSVPQIFTMESTFSGLDQGEYEG